MKSRIFALFLILILCLAGCSDSADENALQNAASGEYTGVFAENQSSAESSEESADVSEESSLSGVTDDGEISETVSEPEPEPTNINPLTGLADMTEEGMGKRPVAVMVSNVKPALPQYGVEQADIIFEMPMEGYQTRLMALYADYTQIPKVCSIRSCRKYFAAISEGFDAIYVNCGMCSVINPYIKSLNLTQYDAAKYTKYNLFQRDQDRLNDGYGREHTLYFDGTIFPEVLEKDGARVDIEEDKNNNAFLFNGLDEQVAPKGDECTSIYIDFGSNETGFAYDAATKTYLMSYKSNPQIDGVTGNQLGFTNLFILETDIGFDKDAVYNANGDMHRYFNWHGGEDSIGYYISNGVIQKIHWEKENEQSRLKFFDEDGNELSINRGKSYICFNNIGDAEFSK